jgi:hypothetical protein
MGHVVEFLACMGVRKGGRDGGREGIEKGRMEEDGGGMDGWKNGGGKELGGGVKERWRVEGGWKRDRGEERMEGGIGGKGERWRRDGREIGWRTRKEGGHTCKIPQTDVHRRMMRELSFFGGRSIVHETSVYDIDTIRRDRVPW